MFAQALSLTPLNEAELTVNFYITVENILGLPISAKSLSHRRTIVLTVLVDYTTSQESTPMVRSGEAAWLSSIRYIHTIKSNNIIRLFSIILVNLSFLAKVSPL